MSKDVVSDRYARLYEIPFQLARLGHDVLGLCLGYGHQPKERVEHPAAPGRLEWVSRSIGRAMVPTLLTYPKEVLEELRRFSPDLVIGASDIPHVALAAWLARRLRLPYAIDLYDNFEGFGQARIPGFVAALRSSTRMAGLVTTTSEPLRDFVLQTYRATGDVLTLPSTVDKSVFYPRDRFACRSALGLPASAPLVGTAGGLYFDKGVGPLYEAWTLLAARRPDVHLVLAGPFESSLPVPQGDRVHYLGHLGHSRVPELFSALNVGIISILDTSFGRYCFPQKAYEMVACGLPVAAARVGAMQSLFGAAPQLLFEAGNSEQLADAVERQLDNPMRPDIEVNSWSALIAQIEPYLRGLVHRNEDASRRRLA